MQTNESKTLFLMTSLPYCCIPGLAEIKTYAQKMRDAQVTKSLLFVKVPMSGFPIYKGLNIDPTVMLFCYLLILGFYFLYFRTNWSNLYPPTKGYFRETCKSKNINEP